MAGRSRNWTLRGVHLYVTCLAALVLLLVGAGRAVTALVDLAQGPPPMVLEELGQKPVPAVEGVGARPAPELVEAQAQVEAERQRNQTGEPWRRLASSLFTVAVAVPVYLYFWRIIRREERQGRWPLVEWGIRNLYFYVISLGAFVAVLVTMSILASCVAQAVVPSPAYYPGPVEVHGMLVSEGHSSPTVPEVQARVDLERQRAEAMAAYMRRRDIIYSAVATAIALAVYLFHWIRCQKAFKALEGEVAAEPA